MKKLLIITYYWPPSGGAGVQRWLKFVRYLREFDWEPVVFTPENPEYPELDDSLLNDIPDELTVIKTPIWEPYSAYKRFIGRGKEEKISAGFLSEKKKPGLAEKLSVWIRGNLFIPDARKFWIRPSIRFLSAYLKDHPVDALASTGPPHSCHLIALGLKQRLHIPWLADFRDPWTHIDFYQDLKLTARADRLHRALEKKVLQQADEVVIISPSQIALFEGIYPRTYRVITNGYDPRDYQLHDQGKPDRHFSIAHVGSLVPSRNPKVLWDALQQLVARDQDFAAALKIKLVGKVDHTVIASLQENQLLPYLEKIDYLPHNEVVRIQFQSQVLLLLINNTPDAGSILTGKFFEYLAARRPVLCIGPPGGDAAIILQKTRAGETAGFEDVDKVKDILWRYYRKFQQGLLSVSPENTDLYSRHSLTKDLAGILDTMIAAQRERFSP